MKKILVTGGLGFIGSHICVSLIEKNYSICIIDSLINSSEDNLLSIKKICNLSNNFLEDRITFFKGDIKNKRFLKHIFKKAIDDKKPIEAVIHLAGLKSVNESTEEPLTYWETNVVGTLNLLEAMQIYNCKNIVFSSSATIYRPTINELLTENSDLGPISPYGTTKLTIEKMLEDLAKSKKNDLNIINLRYFNPVGAHISGLLGENPKGKPNNLFPILLKVASGEYKKLSIFGADWPTHDGTCIRDYIHVMDLAEAHISALNFILNSSSVFINLNIGTGIGKSVLEVVETFMKVNKCEFEYSFVSRRQGDSPYLVADNRLALSTLNWKPQKSLNDMCIDAWKWKITSKNKFK
ncbi:UDP-glucose 4-epimerase GalE [Prochlorococcus marinus]|uniref:UDP-glucose 4-epimerase GalE n=1 Tax=Prochlorococcus marinus TaxID=1219 RepID=UPI00094D88D4|nr:UDP-glucose 4-epimerase GalE [Prochlorococcus marinus]